MTRITDRKSREGSSPLYHRSFNPGNMLATVALLACFARRNNLTATANNMHSLTRDVVGDANSAYALVQDSQGPNLVTIL